MNEGARDGMKRSADHADSVKPKWTDEAYAKLAEFVMNVQSEFIAPNVRSWAKSAGLDSPPTAYAWGAVFARAAREGLIRRAGYTQYGDGVMHTQSVTLWVPNE